jgi:hypothetical protein
MKDWNKLAEAVGIEGDPRTFAPLETLEKTFRPLAERLGPADDISLVLEETES